MAEKRGYRISDIYQGGYSSLDPSNNYITAGSLGMTTDPRSANILQEVSLKLSSGVKQVEIEAVSPEIFDSIPKQQLREVNRLSKLTGVDVSIHAPVSGMNVSGITQQGYSETDREAMERKVADILIRSHDLNPEGNIPVNFHSAEGIPGSQLLPPSKRKLGEKYQRMIIINQQTGRLAPLEPEIRYYPEAEKLEPQRLTPEQELDIHNRTEWDNSISQVIFNKERADEILEGHQLLIQHLFEDLKTGKLRQGEPLSPEQEAALRHYRNAEAYLQDLNKQINTFFSRAYEFGTEHQREILKTYSEKFKKDLADSPDLFLQSKAMHNLLHGLKNPQVAPNLYVPIEKFAIEKSSETFGKAAWDTYKKLKGKNIPILTIENPPAGFGLSTGEDIKNLVEKSREQFVKKAVADGGLSENEATKQAEKLIGATWDVGHINMLRKFGYSEKEIIEETKHVAPLLKHVHLSDNFGFEHTELPMGMGNVPLKEMMKKLGKKGFEARKIVEAAAWWQHWKTPPFQETLEAVGSPIYGMKMAPYWSQAPGLYQGYFSGYGQMFPQVHYETFGAGFSRLPQELGGQVQGAQGSRMSGRPME